MKNELLEQRELKLNIYKLSLLSQLSFKLFASLSSVQSVVKK